jgi:hypothetical protein
VKSALLAIQEDLEVPGNVVAMVMPDQLVPLVPLEIKENPVVVDRVEKIRVTVVSPVTPVSLDQRERLDKLDCLVPQDLKVKYGY